MSKEGRGWKRERGREGSKGKSKSKGGMARSRGKSKGGWVARVRVREEVRRLQG